MWISRSDWRYIEKRLDRLEAAAEKTESRVSGLEENALMYDQGEHIPGFPRKKTRLKTVVFGILDHLKLKVYVRPSQPEETFLKVIGDGGS